MNSVNLIGRLTRDPETSYTPSQMAVCKFTIAVDRPRRKGEDAGADFIRITVFGKQAESCGQYLSKGRQVAISGRIQTGSYKDRDGKTVYTTDIIADRAEFLGGGQNQNQGHQNQQYSGQQGQYNDPYQGQQYGSQGQYNDPYQGQQYGGQQGFEANAFDSSAFDDMPDSFQSAEDDIPF